MKPTCLCRILVCFLNAGFNWVQLAPWVSGISWNYVLLGKLKRILQCYPDIFTVRQRDLDSIVSVLREKCLFTGRQVTQILHRCPHVLREDPAELEYKFQVRVADG